MRKRTITGSTLAAISVLVLAACGGSDSSSSSSSTDSGSSSSSGSSKAQGARVYMNQYSQGIQYFRDKNDGFIEAANKAGMKPDTEYGNSTPEQQVQQVQNALTKQPKAIVITPIDAKSLEPVLRQAKSQSIPVFTVGANVSDPSLYTSFIAATNYDVGKQKAEYVVKKLGGKGKVGIIHGIRGLTFSEDQAKAFTDVFKTAPGIQVVDGGYAGGFASDLGLAKTQSLLTRDPNLDAIIYDADDITLGGIQAIAAAGISNDKIVVVSTDGNEAALKAVEQGKIDMTVSLCGYAQGYQIVDAVTKTLNGETVPNRIQSKTQEFTTENIKALSAKPRSFCG
jgi:ABC-type sugar transport system substrate-binding protein